MVKIIVILALILGGLFSGCIGDESIKGKYVLPSYPAPMNTHDRLFKACKPVIYCMAELMKENLDLRGCKPDLFILIAILRSSAAAGTRHSNFNHIGARGHEMPRSSAAIGSFGSIIFNFERFKRVHDITPDAELIDFKESGEGMKPISEEEAKMLYAFRMVWKAEKEKTERPIHDQLVSNG